MRWNGVNGGALEHPIGLAAFLANPRKAVPRHED